MTDTDVLIVGGGPAGVISAYTAAKKGCSVVLVDQKPRAEIGNKTCGDALDLAACNFIKEKLGLELPHGNEVWDIVENLILKTDKVELPINGEGFVVDRHHYGKRLLIDAERAGVEIRNNIKVKSAQTNNGTVNGINYKNSLTKKEGQITAKVTIDCSGYRSIVRKTLPFEVFPLLEHHILNRDLIVSYREIIRFKNGISNHPYRNKISLIYMKEIPIPGYFWIFSKGDYHLNVGICYFKEAKIGSESPKGLYQKIINQYYTPDQYDILDGKGYHIPTRYPLTNAVSNGFLTAGDAAHHVDPFTFEGHGPALIAGYYAGKTAAEAIEANDISQERLWTYNTAIMDHFGRQQCKTQAFAEAFQKIGLTGFEFVFEKNIISTDEFLELNKGKKPGFLSILRKMRRLFPRYNLLPILYKVANFTSKIDEIFSTYPDNPKEYPSWNKRYLSLIKTISK